MSSEARVRRLALTGNKAAAQALMLARIQALCYFPIGPSDEVAKRFPGTSSGERSTPS